MPRKKRRAVGFYKDKKGRTRPITPRVVYHHGWEPPRHLVEEIKKKFKQSPNRDTASDLEAIAYLQTASLAGPPSPQYCRIYFYLMRKYMQSKGWKKFQGSMAFLNKHKTLSEVDQRELNRLKEWIFRTQKKDSVQRRKQGLFSVMHIPPSDMTRGYTAQWYVSSHSDPSKQYKVSLKSDGSYSCSCSHWKFRRPAGGCKHIKEVQMQTRVKTGKPAPTRLTRARKPKPKVRTSSVKEWLEGTALPKHEGSGEWQLFTFNKQNKSKIEYIRSFPSRALALKTLKKLPVEERKRTSQPTLPL